MTDHDEGFRSVTGLPETADPASAAEDSAPPAANTPGATGATTNPITPAHTSLRSSSGAPPRPTATHSQTNSPMSSRDPSPSRSSQPHRQTPAMAGPARRVQRSRKNSNQDGSPNRPSALANQTTTAPSAAAIQRALASANTPQLQPTPADSTRVPRPHKSNNHGDSTPHWPVSPRLKSPPPSHSRSRRNSLRSQQQQQQQQQQLQPPHQARPQRPDPPQSTQSAPNIVVERTATPPSAPAKQKNEPPPSDSEDQDGTNMVRKGSGRTVSGAPPALETVQEASLPTSPGFDVFQAHSNNPAKSSSDDTVVANSTESVKENSKARESGSESGGNNRSEDRGRRTEQKKASSARPSATSRGSFTGLVPGKSRSVTEPSKNMTVETETVRSVPQGVMGQPQGGPAPGRGEPSGSLRLKLSNETIRPRREKRRTVRKAPSITSGTGRYPPQLVRNPFSHHHVPVVDPVSPVRPDLQVRSNTIPPLSTTDSNIQSFRSLGFPSPGDLSQFTQTPSTTVSKQMSSKYTNDSPRKASSKADIFEAKVASAVDEANSSDSDETFVYESNPPDTQPRASRHHSRTPSATSMASMVDHPRLGGGLRSINNVLEGHRSVAGKRSMKFANNPYGNSSLDEDVSERFDGTLRGNHSRPSGSHSNYHHHIGRYGRNAAVNSLFEDGPAPPGSKSRSVSGYGSRHGSAPSSPKFPHYSSRTSNPSSRKMGELSAYDMDGEGADDERTPLMGTVRTRRAPARGPRPTSASLHYHDHYERRRRGCLRRFAGCFVLTIMVLLLAFGAVGFLFATTKPLYKVEVVEIQNVLASEQEIMLDLLVEAVNPNIVAVSIGEMDVNIFAKSKHVGTEKFWRDQQPDGVVGPRELGRRRPRAPSHEDDEAFHTLDDDPHDPVEDPEGDSQTMLLGRIFHFDSPLNFDGDPLKRRPHYSIGELRLQKPGNKTEAGGTERWERVIQYPFELIVRGILRYQLPLSSSTHTAPIGRSVLVNPEKGVNAEGAMWIEQIRRSLVGEAGEDEE
ncbi:Phospholipid metabolism enzyme [Lasiodiplodia theobromae]|uniref:Phospholipid metabolism enzyme n=1 Tax=Lasiodiplodia theobromae TaxID=45133 RepID=UPI0015C3B8A0|nr:Phospholipid metabolism enzyme [Lasiodiplodia theobromae]KAF4536627.1 Phospholipid metabolism enzyme [Lasiodiplodia theobromae]